MFKKHNTPSLALTGKVLKQDWEYINHTYLLHNKKIKGRDKHRIAAYNWAWLSQYNLATEAHTIIEHRRQPGAYTKFMDLIKSIKQIEHTQHIHAIQHMNAPIKQWLLNRITPKTHKTCRNKDTKSHKRPRYKKQQCLIQDIIYKKPHMNTKFPIYKTYMALCLGVTHWKWKYPEHTCPYCLNTYKNPANHILYQCTEARTQQHNLAITQHNTHNTPLQANQIIPNYTRRQLHQYAQQLHDKNPEAWQLFTPSSEDEATTQELLDAYTITQDAADD